VSRFRGNDNALVKLNMKLSRFINYFFSILLVTLCLSPFWPKGLWPLASLLQFAPLWLLGLPIVFLFLFNIFSKDMKYFVLTCLSAFILLFGLMGLKIGKYSPSPSRGEQVIKVLSVNLGEGVNYDQLRNLVGELDPDIVTLQEMNHSHDENIKRRMPPDFHTAFKNHLGIASRFPILESTFKTRRFLGEWGGVVGEAVLDTPYGFVTALSVHLESPRDGFEAVMDQKWQGLDEMKKITNRQEAESELASGMALSHEYVIVAGDFNMMEMHPLYNRYWSKLKNAFSKKGWGFGHTKFIRWHGVRIDHILVDKHFSIKKALVGPDLGGDHRPLYAEIVFD